MTRDRLVVTGVSLPTATLPPEERPPFALGMVMAYARKVLGSDAAFDVAPRFARSMKEAEQILAIPGRHVFLYSDYMWSAPDNLAVSRRVKELRPDAINIHGGPHVPAFPEVCEQYLRTETHVDFAVRGEGELPLVDLLRAIAEGDAREAFVANVSTLRRGVFVQHPTRERPRNLDEFPSPYLDGTFDVLNPERWTAGIIETNRGCPYGCTFCDWGAATLQKIRTFDLERLRAELEWLGSRKVRNLWTADANFGILPRDVEVARMVVETKKKYGYPRAVITQFAKNTHQHLIDILELYVEAGLVSNGTISLQTRDPGTLGIVRRKNIKTREYDKLRTEFQRRGLPMAVQLMIGLPGATVDAFQDDLAFYFDEPVEVQMFRTVLLPNAPMAEPSYMAAHEIVHREDGLVTSTKTMSEKDFTVATLLARAFSAVHHFGVLRYPILYLHHDLGIAPLQLARELAESEADLAKRFPLLHGVLNADGDSLYLFQAPEHLLEQCRAEDRWVELADQLYAWLQERHPFPRTTAWDAVCAAQAALMPAAGRTYPHVEALEHDVVAWYAAIRRSEHVPLADYGPGVLTVEDPLRFGAKRYVLERLTRWQWELASPLARARVGEMGGVRLHHGIDLVHPEVALSWVVAAEAT